VHLDQDENPELKEGLQGLY